MGSQSPHFLNHYFGHQLDRLALPVGGIGTGTISLGGRGQLQDWEIVNHSSKGFSPSKAFLAMSLRSAGKPVDCRILEGNLPASAYEGGTGSPALLPGMPRFAKASARATYPFMEVELSDPACPVTARVRAFNPFIPSDVPGSSWPVAVIEVELANNGQNSYAAAVALACENFVGTDGIDSLAAPKRNRTRLSGKLGAVMMDAPRLPRKSELRGDFCIAVEKTGGNLSVSQGLEALVWQNDIRNWFDQLAWNGRVVAPKRMGLPLASVCLERRLPAGKSALWRFFVAWRFPNRLAWTEAPNEERKVVGNYYCGLGRNSWEILQTFVPKLPALRQASIRFTHLFSNTSLPQVIREAALANLPVLRSQTLFRTPDGRFFGYEGGHRLKYAMGTLGSCTHVWGYDLATSFLFPEIARSFRELHFGPSQFADGAIAFRTGLPLRQALRYGKVAADGQLAAIIGFYRDVRLNPDPQWAQKMWPNVRKALQFCWAKGSWDPQKTGVMGGCQHNTLDVDYYGENPLMQGLYVTALRCGAALAERFGESDFAELCRRLAAAGAELLDRHLFNGDYFEQRIPESCSGLDVDPRTGFTPFGPAYLDGEPDYQIGQGVLIDQMLGGLHARVCGLEEPAEKGSVKRALKAVARWNYRQQVGAERNHMRTYALADEAAVVMASWPNGGKPATPLPYYSEVMTGFEHVLAAHLFYHEENRIGLRVVRDIRKRYTGVQRNPFNEAEYGNHYARTLASWAGVWAWTGQQYEASAGALSFKHTAVPVLWPWFAGEAWGTIALSPEENRCRVKIKVEYGSLNIRSLKVGDFTADLVQLLPQGVAKNITLRNPLTV